VSHLLFTVCVLYNTFGTGNVMKIQTLYKYVQTFQATGTIPDRICGVRILTVSILDDRSSQTLRERL
jgi:hypothetical protein